jgi:hypothetical protein
LIWRAEIGDGDGIMSRDNLLQRVRSVNFKHLER